jgi:uncharacterized protein YbjT (DUF2867 family)
MLMRVLMVGATGRHGQWVLRALVDRGVGVRALVRNQERAQAARDSGAEETVIADLKRAATLTEAMAGVDGVFHIGPGQAPAEADMGVAMVQAARATGVRKFVLSGVIHPSISALTNHTAKLPVEDALYTSELAGSPSRAGSATPSPGLASSTTPPEPELCLPRRETCWGATESCSTTR